MGISSSEDDDAAEITWIHLSDLHAGQRKGDAVWHQVERELERSVRQMAERLGLPDLLLFTGDLAFTGDAEEYEKVDRLLDLVNDWLGVELPVFAVPGNHDLARPKPSYRYSWLKAYEQEEELRKDLWERDVGLLDPLFEGYSAWARRRVVGSLTKAGCQVHVSRRVPGDLCAVFEKRGSKLGLVGLNSSWAQYDGGDFEGSLQLPREQFYAALPPTEGNPLAWFDGLDRSLLLTHHPRTWLTERARVTYDEAIYDPKLFALTLFGHAHLPRSEVVARSGTAERAFFQAPSLFGLEHYGTEEQTRICGYAWGRLTAEGEIRVWPLKGTSRGDNSYEFDRDTDFSPGDDGEWGGVELVPGRAAVKGRPQEGDEARARVRSPSPVAEDPVRPEELARYLNKIATKHEYIQLIGFGTKARVPLKLDDLYVPLDAIIDRGCRGREVYASAEFAATAKLGDNLLRQEPLALAQAFTRAQAVGRKGLVLLGDPGSGKTTHLKQVLLKVVRDGSESIGLPAGMLPVFLPLQKLRDRKAGLPAFINEQLEGPSLAMEPDFGLRLCKRDKLLLLLDGLDEVADAEERELVARWIEAARVDMPDSYLLVSCRYAGYAKDVELESVFLELHLRPLGDEQMRKFVRNWYRLVEGELSSDPEQAAIEATTKATRLLEVLEGKEFSAARLYEMTRNPLLLTAICLVHHDQDRLPGARDELYEESIAVLLERWRRSRPDAPLSAADALAVLQPVAAWMHDESERKRATKAELLGPVSKALARQRGVELEADRFLQVIRDESGLLTGWGVDEYGFMHLGFQEYLTAEHLRNEGVEDNRVFESLAAHFDDSWWQEVILLMLAQRNPSVFKPFMRALVKQPGFVSWSDTEMMQRCLSESAMLSPEPFMELLRAPVRSPDSEQLGPRQLAAARLIERAIPLVGQERVEFSDLMSEHPTSAVRAWWRGEPVQAAARDGEVIKAPRGGVELLRIPGGRFTMGSPDDEEGRFDDELRHEVELADFRLARTPVTNEQYAKFLQANTQAAKPEYWADRRFNQPEQPVVGVSWEEAQAYCEWAGLMLPTEAQWEYACRAGMSTRYWSGDGDEDLERVGWVAENSGPRLHGVGEKAANPFGLLDMHGNVWEWCREEWGDPTTSPREGDGLRQQPVGDGVRVIRGGSWALEARYARSAIRDYGPPGLRDAIIGFRPSQGHS